MAGKSKAMIGQRFGMLTVLSLDTPHRTPNGTLQQRLRCRCDCGNEVTVSYTHLKNGQNSCGCAKHDSRFEDLTGMRFGKLLVKKHIGRKNIGTGTQYSQLWECLCDCGNKCAVSSRALKSSNTRSCGCLQGEKLRASHLNQYDLSSDVGKGFCADGRVFLFDIDDYPLLKDFTWYFSDTGYLVTTYKGKQIRMHRMLCGLSEGDKMVVDHINHNTYDNRRCNLRVCLAQQNSFNKVDPKNNTSGHIGVGVLDDKYRAFIEKDGIPVNLGVFDTYAEAVAAREAAEKKYFGEFAIERM